MSSIQCCISGCKLKPEYLCGCTNPKSAVCITHLNSHGEPSIVSHPFENIFSRPLEKTKISLLARLREEKMKISAIKQKFISDETEFIKNAEDSLKNKIEALTSGIKVIDYYIVTIMAADEIERKSDDSLLNLLLLSPNEALLKINQVIKDNIDFGSIADNCCFEERQDMVNANALETNEKINKLEREVKELREEISSLRELKEEVKSLREFIALNAIDYSSNIEKQKSNKNNEESKEIVSVVKGLEKELQFQMNSFSASAPLSSLIPDTSLLNFPIIHKPPKPGLKDFGNTSYINSLIQVLASFKFFVEIIVESYDDLLKTLSKLLLSINYSSSQEVIDDLLLETATALAQAYPIINSNKDPKLLLEFIISKFNEVCPGYNLFTIVKHDKIVCALGHIDESGSKEIILNVSDLPNGQMKDAIDSLKALKLTDMNCSFCNKIQICTISMAYIELPCFLVISFRPNNNFVLPEMFCYQNSSYELFGAIKKVPDHRATDKYIALTKDDGVWSKYDNLESECRNIDFKGCYLAFYMSV
ncbi:unnamed protein product [Blepharisma stoltei]|uniref:USP domain-containing protein n=1 Tax=Blepharisma stoltei TaxID=1481888 RepID=A0AAU9JIS2_9CILI|nr:unnamed protein product [Blepharisma stoltei]